jgi:protein disulfide-isomerase A6
MVRTTALLAATAAFTLHVHAESMYPKKSGVLSITGMDYDRLIAQSNYTSVSLEYQWRRPLLTYSQIVE